MTTATKSRRTKQPTLHLRWQCPACGWETSNSDGPAIPVERVSHLCPARKGERRQLKPKQGEPSPPISTQLDGTQ